MPEPWWRTEHAVDLVVAGVFGVLAVIETIVDSHGGGQPVRVAVVAVAGLGGAALLYWRHRIPAVVVVGTVVCAAAGSAAAGPASIGPLAPAVALFTLATIRGWRPAVLAGVAALIMTTGAALVRHAAPGGPLLQATVILGAATLAGLYTGERRQVLTAVAARAAQLEREQVLRAREAVLAERVWIARELHDAIGHHVTLLVVQAGAVRSTIPVDHPARIVLDSMIDGGKEAMTEMRRMVDVLRPVTGETMPDGSGPPPGVDDLPSLCAHLRSSGLPVDCEISGAGDMPRTASVAAYRIVQEALTNVVKHAGPVPTQVRVTRTPELLDVRVTNTPGVTTITSGDRSSGLGHAGMRQRVALFDGRFFAGPVPDGGYAVQATLRLRSDP